MFPTRQIRAKGFHRSRLGALVSRFLRIVGAYCFACLASAYSIGLMLSVPPTLMALLKGDFADANKFLGFLAFYLGLIGFYVAFAIAAVSVIPATLVIAYAEMARLRSALFYGVTGALLANICYAVVQLMRLRLPDLSFASDRMAGVALIALCLGVAGLIGGLVYWLTAGRSAGDWRVYQPTQR